MRVPIRTLHIYEDAIHLLQQLIKIREYQDKPSIANQGQCLDGISALAHYNYLAADVEKFFYDNEIPK